jgi:phosphoribosylformylglycinamidine synthase
MVQWITLSGSSALSDFRAAALREAIGAEAVRAIWLHFVHFHDGYSGETSQVLEQLLQYGPGLDDANSQALEGVIQQRPAESLPADTWVYYVIPRPGTISPWSSKATSIAHVAGLAGQVKRIERGMAIAISSQTAVRPDVCDLLHDRMTQVGPRPCL